MPRALLVVVSCAAVALLTPSLAAARLHGRIAFASDRGSRLDYTSIWVMHADGTHSRRFGSSRHFDQDPSWSPSGRSIAFSRLDQTTIGTSVWVMRVRGHHRHRRRVISDASQPAWSPNGDWLAVSRLDGVWLVHPDGSGAHWIADGAGPAWSPDGRRLAVTEESVGDSGTSGLRIVAADGSKAATIFEGPERGMPVQPAWSPDGDRIVFARDFFRGNTGELWSIPAAGGTPVRLIRNGGDADFSPTGRHLIFEATSDPRGGGRDRLYVTDGRGHHRRDLVGRRQAWFGEDLDDADWHR